ncbi:unnamed protein product [Rotaria socialis]|uniref:DNA helicase Pif1-like 2B domain-containing protein n=1 Tax=Rotaria socialis TaxID=392032 RepID=A0A820RBU1_9BILA|nr:unnamed protein product [Rotaria socialis]CAF4432914.1 unnamed protein product [Rotaria socialis]
MRTWPSEEEFSKWLIKLGNGELSSKEYDEIELPSCCMLDGNLIGDIFDQHISINGTLTLCNRTMANEEVLQRLPGKEIIYTSMDDVECEDSDNVTNYPTECLNSLTPSGMPSHKLKLKIGAIVMLLHNLDIEGCECGKALVFFLFDLFGSQNKYISWRILNSLISRLKFISNSPNSSI